MGSLLSRNEGVKNPEEDKSENFTELNAVTKQNMPNAKQNKRREDGNKSDRPSKSRRRSPEKKALVDDWNAMHNDIQRYKSQINQLESSRSENKREIADYKAKLQSAEQENIKLQEELAGRSENKREIAEYKEKLQSAEQENTKLREKLAGRSESKHEIADYKAKLQSAEQEITRLQQELASQSETKKEIAEYKAKLQGVEKENTRLQEKLAEANTYLTRKDKDIHTLEIRVAEKDKLITRLSTITGANLTDNNPNIADLSDSNRPTKLAERYTALYDDVWTDSFTAMNNKGIPERDCLDILRDILMDIYKLCESSAESQMKSLYKAMEQMTKVDKIQILPVEVLKGLKEARKKNYKSFLPELTKEVDRRLQDKHADEETRLYKTQCLELCWLMCIQDPPVYMDCDDAIHGKPFSKEAYKTYLKTGPTVDYVVWPALFMHKEGPLLCKGTAQGMAEHSLPTQTSGVDAGRFRSSISVKK